MATNQKPIIVDNTNGSPQSTNTAVLPGALSASSIYTLANKASFSGYGNKQFVRNWLNDNGISTSLDLANALDNNNNQLLRDLFGLSDKPEGMNTVDYLKSRYNISGNLYGSDRRRIRSILDGSNKTNVVQKGQWSPSVVSNNKSVINLKSQPTWSPSTLTYVNNTISDYSLLKPLFSYTPSDSTVVKEETQTPVNIQPNNRYKVKSKSGAEGMYDPRTGIIYYPNGRFGDTRKKVMGTVVNGRLVYDKPKKPTTPKKKPTSTNTKTSRTDIKSWW